MFMQPSREFQERAFDRAIAKEDLWIDSQFGRLHGWFIYPAASDRCDAIILFYHGNAENVSTHSHAVAWLAKYGYCAFAPDYPGYGKSAGEANIEDLHSAASLMLDKAVIMAESRRVPLVVFGQSLGGAVAIYTVAKSASRNRVAAVIVESAFSGYSRIAQEKAAEHTITWLLQPFVYLLTSDRYSPDRCIKELAPLPLVVMHGERDRTVPISHAKILYEAAGEPKQFWETMPGGHVSSFKDAAVRDRLVEYIRSLPRIRDRLQDK